MEEQNKHSATGNGHAAEAHESIDNMASRARPAVDRFASGAHQAVDRLVGVANQAADRFSSRSSSLRGSQEQMLDDARAYVRNKPGTAIGMAVAAGFILSRILR